MSSKRELLPLTGLRFFLALWVVLYHQPFLSDTAWTLALPSPIPILLRTGYLAVGLFFVLSGFVLGYNYSLARPWTPELVHRFAAGRFARIYPAYLLGLILTAPFVIADIARNASTAKIIKGAAAGLLNVLLLQAWIPQTAMTWNHPGWSLSVETLFYASFPVLGVLVWRAARPRAFMPLLVIIWLASLVAPTTAQLLQLIPVTPVALSAPVAQGATADWFSFVAYHPLVHLPQFCAGILIARIYQWLMVDRAAAPASSIGVWLYSLGFLLEIGAIALCQKFGVSFFLLANGLLLPLHVMVILGLAIGGGPLARVLAFAPIVILGRASYSLYILHIPVSNWLRTVAREQWGIQLEGGGAMTLYVLVVVAVSLLVWRFVEEPANQALKRWLAPRPAAVLRVGPDVRHPKHEIAAGHEV